MTFWETILDLFGCYYHPAIHATPAPNWKREEEAGLPPQAETNIRNIGNKSYVVNHNTEFDSEYDLANKGNIEGRKLILTRLDAHEILNHKRTLNIEEAAVIKPHWANGLTNANISVELKKAFPHGKFSTRKVSDYCACFARVLEAEKSKNTPLSPVHM